MLKRLLGRPETEADVRIAAAHRTFDLRYMRRRRVLLWTWLREERWRLTVSALPLRDLIALHRRIENAELVIGGTLKLHELCVYVTGSLRAVYLTEEQLSAIWQWHLEANALAGPKAPAGPARPEGPPRASASPTSSSSSSAGRSASPSERSMA